MAQRNAVRHWAGLAWLKLHEFFTGAALSWISVPMILARRNHTERIFVFNMLMESAGLPLLPPRERLFLLSSMVPQIMSWRRRLRLWDDSLETADLRHLGH